MSSETGNTELAIMLISGVSSANQNRACRNGQRKVVDSDNFGIIAYKIAVSVNFLVFWGKLHNFTQTAYNHLFRTDV